MKTIEIDEGYFTGIIKDKRCSNFQSWSPTSGQKMPYQQFLRLMVTCDFLQNQHVLTRTYLPHPQPEQTTTLINDRQSGYLIPWEIALEQVDANIRSSYENPETGEALRKIGAIWSRIETSSELAAARHRLLLGKFPSPKLAETPQWFEDQKKILLEEGDELDPASIRLAERLVRAICAAWTHTDPPRARLTIGPLGKTVLDWTVPGRRLQWIVEALPSPWPALKIYEYSQIEGHTASSRIIHDASEAIRSINLKT